MKCKFLTLLAAASFALFFNACGDDSSSSASFDCLDTENCLDDDELSSSSEEDPASSSSEKSEKDDKSSSSVKDDESSSSTDDEKSSSSVEATSSSSEIAEESSSSVNDGDSSSSGNEGESSSSSNEGESSSSTDDEKSSSSVEATSSSSEAESSSSEEAESSSSESKPLVYTSTTPNLADLEVSGDTLFAIFQRQDASYTINHNGLLVLFDLSSGDVLDTIQLATKNPSTVKVANGNVYVATAGAYDASFALPADNNRGLEKVDLKNKTSNLFVSGSKLGGGIQDFVVDKKNNKGYAQIYKSYGNALVAEINLSTGSVTKIGDGVIVDPTGGLEFDEKNSLLYIGDRYLNYTTFEMHITVYTYDGTNLNALTDPEMEMRMPYSIKTIQGAPYVFMSDYNSGVLYFNYQDDEDDEDGILSFYQDSKLAVVNNELFVMSRDQGGASIAKINTLSRSAVWQKTTIGKNPYDMVAASAGTAWVAYYDSPVLEQVSTSDLSNIKTIDTKAFCAVEVE